MHHQIDAAELGIDLRTKNEDELFKWFLACLLFGKLIQRRVAEDAYHTLIDAKIDSLDKLAKTTWDALVALLDKGHYVRYDYSSAT